MNRSTLWVAMVVVVSIGAYLSMIEMKHPQNLGVRAPAKELGSGEPTLVPGFSNLYEFGSPHAPHSRCLGLGRIDPVTRDLELTQFHCGR
jgi:hypothetical protein